MQLLLKLEGVRCMLGAAAGLKVRIQVGYLRKHNFKVWSDGAAAISASEFTVLQSSLHLRCCALANDQMMYLLGSCIGHLWLNH